MLVANAVLWSIKSLAQQSNSPIPTVQLAITVHATQPYTPRSGAVDNSWPPDTLNNLSQGDLRFETNRPTPAISTTDPSKMSGADYDFATSNALVLLKHNSLTMDIAGSASTGASVKFKVFRDAADSSTVGTGNFTIIPAVGLTPARMKADKRGSFFLVGYVDSNSSGDFDVGEPSAVIPVIIVEADVVYENSFASDTAITYFNGLFGLDPASNLFCGGWPGGPGGPPRPGNPAITLNARVKLTGGGTTGRRGTDRVYAGWTQQIQYIPLFTTTYTDVLDGVTTKTTRQIAASNIAGRPITIDYPTFLPGVVPTLLALPLIDSGRSLAHTGADVGTGANSITPASSRMFVTKANPTVGKWIDVTAIDSPVAAVPGAHPDPINVSFKISEISANYQFRTYLTLWTSPAVQNPDPQTDEIPAGPTLPDNIAGERTYFDAYRYYWQVGGTATIDPLTGNEINLTKFSQITSQADFSPISPADATGRAHETRPPAFIRYMSVDATR